MSTKSYQDKVLSNIIPENSIFMDFGNDIQNRLLELSNKVSLLEVSWQLMSSIDLNDVLLQVSTHLKILLEADLVMIDLVKTKISAYYQETELNLSFEDFVEYFFAGKGIGGLAFKNGKVVSTSNYWVDSDIDHSPKVDLFLQNKEILSALAVPIFVEDTIVAIITVYKNTEFEWSPLHKAQAEQFTSLISLAIYNAERYYVQVSLNKDLNIRTQHLEDLQDFNRRLRGPLSLEATVERALSLAMEAMQADAGALYLFELNNKENLLLLYHKGLNNSNFQVEMSEWPNTVQINQGLVGAAAAKKQVIVLDDMPGNLLSEQSSTSSQILTPLDKSAIFLPLIVDQEVLGVLSLLAHNKLHFSRERIEFGEMVGKQIAIAVKQVRMIEQHQQEEKLVAVQTLARTAAHELNQPLTVLQIALSLISDLSQTPEQEVVGMMQEAIDIMVSKVREYQKIINYKTITNQQGFTVIDYDSAKIK